MSLLIDLGSRARSRDPFPKRDPRGLPETVCMALELHLQSSHEALRDLIYQLESARGLAEEAEEETGASSVPSGELDRIISQCQGLMRKLDQWRARL